MHSRSCDARQHTSDDLGDTRHEGALRGPRAYPRHHRIRVFKTPRRRVIGTDNPVQAAIAGCRRARARHRPTSTYVSLLVRSHLRAQTPLPTPELAALKRSVAEIGAIGRNLNQIAQALNSGAQVTGMTRADPQSLMRALYGLRDHIKSLINGNLTSWRTGYEKTSH